ncbi:helix-turn-helix domain-containing protein [Marmoricola sp. URHB0036]|uniref:helix-turn-helix domain-containing protein n=1 Tax=Marmoricola sp. URHB0036 TaxID=1298863 RepID=UPI0003F5649B|nr:helix-turn-helix domain-containing protein [Marmoricola sp. URHB0036]
MYPTSVRQEALRLLAEGRSINSVSGTLGISRAAIRDWRDNGIDRAAAFDCPAHPTSPQYAALFGYYLGDGCRSVVGRAYALRVSCDSTWPGIVDDVEACIRAVHPNRPVFRVRAPGAIVVQQYWQHWPCLFPQHGPGRKHERRLGMADWQREIVAAHPGDFLRGLFHSDGARVRNWTTRMVAGERKRYDYPRWQFVNMSPEILAWCGEALDLVDVAWRRSNHKTVSVSRRDAVARLDALIGVKR